MEGIRQLVENAEQKADRSKMADTALHHASAKAALEIFGEITNRAADGKSKLNPNEIAAIIYRTMRNEREL